MEFGGRRSNATYHNAMTLAAVPYVNGPLLARRFAAFLIRPLRPYLRPVGALAHERWPRWFPRREFQTTSDLIWRPWGPTEYPVSWID